MQKTVGTPSVIKELNKNVIKDIIKTKGPVSKPEIAKIAKLSLVTVNKIVDLLLEENQVKISEMNQNTVGRKAQYFVINENAGYYLGLYYRNGHFTGAVANSIGTIVHEEEFSVRKGSLETVMEDTTDAVRVLRNKCENVPVLAVGIGVPGVVQDGCVSNIPQIPEWEGVDVAGILEEMLGLNVYLENDINLLTLGVYYGDFKNEAENLLLAYLDQGIGAGIILNGNLFKGSTNFAGEFGNLPIPKEMAEPENGRENLENQLMKLREQLKAAEKGGNAKKGEALRHRYLQIVAYGLLSVVCILNPEVIVIQCETVSQEDLSFIEKQMEEYVGVEHMPWITKISRIQNYGVQGAVNLCIRENSPSYFLEKRG